MDNIYRMSDENEFKGYLKTFLGVTDQAIIDAYLDELRSIPPNELRQRLSKIQKTDKPKLNRETSDNLFSPFQETQRVKMKKVDESKVSRKVDSQDIFEPQVEYSLENMELLKEYFKDFTSIPKHKSKKTTVGGKSKKYRHKNKRRSTRRRR